MAPIDPFEEVPSESAASAETRGPRSAGNRPAPTCPMCGHAVEAQSVTCPSCGEPLSRSDARRPDGPVGLGGWLILPALGLCITPLAMLASIVEVASSLDSPELRVLTDPESDYYLPGVSALIYGELALNAIGGLWAVSLLFLFFRKRRLFRPLMIAYLAFGAFVSIAVLVLFGGVVGFDEMTTGGAGDEMAGEMGRAIAAGLIWIPYFVVSRRVKNTFIR